MDTEIVSKPKKIIVSRGGLKVVRLNLAKGETIAEHSTNADVVVVVTRGEGTFYINQVPQFIKAGDVLEMQPGVPHAIMAATDLELIVNHMQLKPKEDTPISCGAETCSH